MVTSDRYHLYYQNRVCTILKNILGANLFQSNAKHISSLTVQSPGRELHPRLVVLDSIQQLVPRKTIAKDAKKNDPVRD